MAKKINVKGVEIRITKIDHKEYISLTDIAKNSNTEARFLIMSWLKNSSTIEFLETWEELHNPNFNREHLLTVKTEFVKNRNALTPKKWIELTNAIGLISKAGRHGGGTYAHSNIALNFCYWLSPSFQVYLIREFERLKEDEAERKNFEWHITKITNNIDDVRNLLDSIPGQLDKFKRIKSKQKKKDK